VLQLRAADPVADRVVAALRLAREFGGAQLGTLLRNLSGMLREDGRIRAEIAGRQSWTVAAARMAVVAPWVTLALLCTRPETVAAYATAAGGVLLAVAAVLSAIAYWVMVRIGRLPTDERTVA
jgi:tight adherence protein B